MKNKTTAEQPVEIISGNQFLRVDEYPSKIAPGAMALDDYYVCPRCGTRLNDPAHLKSVQCTKCKLWVMMLGAAMQISDSPMSGPKE